MDLQNKINLLNLKKKLLSLGLIISTLGFIGCESDNSSNTKKQEVAVIINNGNALIVETYFFNDKWHGIKKVLSNTDNIYKITTNDGSSIYSDSCNVFFIVSDNAKEKAEILASTLIDEDGKIEYYDEKIKELSK